MNEAVDDAADEIVRVARDRADHVVQIAQNDADRDVRSQSTEASVAQARTLLEYERSNADAILQHERMKRRSSRSDGLAVEREATNKDLTGERANSDTLIVDLREANERMVSATIRAQELAVEADTAKDCAEAVERELRAVSEFREMFIGILGHDLRNPLGAIDMAVAVLLGRGQLDEKDAQTTTLISRSSERMSRMIAQLLDLTRVRLGGGLSIDPTPTDLSEVCRDIVEELGPTIQLEVHGDVTGMWDADRLAEVLSNLAGNATEYASPGTVVIVTALADGADVVVGVSNQGPPIPADALPFIFEPFRRGRVLKQSAKGNLGLGLYIAHQVVLAHGGTLDARSADGTTTFEMRLPRRPPPGGASSRGEGNGL